MAELGVLFGEDRSGGRRGRGRGRRAGADGGGIGEVDAGVPEAVAELPYEELDRVGKRCQLTQLIQVSPEIV